MEVRRPNGLKNTISLAYHPSDDTSQLGSGSIISCYSLKKPEHDGESKPFLKSVPRQSFLRLPVF
jgi:hypothetical protein